MVDKTQRRLAAILAADVAGYTRLVEFDTDGTVAAWKSARDNVIKPQVDKKSGHIIKFTGDGFLVEFPSVQDAVACAITLQEELRSSSLNFRIGINVGDITDDGGDVHGEGVNIAARLEALAEPGGICISGDVYNQVRNRIDAAFKDMGEQEVKHVSRPVSVFAINPTKLKTSNNLTPLTPALPDKPSIAILPFDNMSGDSEQEYFSDGISEDLTTALSRFDGLFVIARNSAFAYKGEVKDIKRIGRELGVRYLLEGSVRRAGERVRVNAQLIDADADRHVWAERFDRQVEDVFELQDDIVASIAATVGPEITLAEIERARNKRPDALDTWDLYLRAFSAYYPMTEDSVAEAVSLLQKAIEAEPEFANAYALLGLCHAHIAMHGWVKPVSLAYGEARRLTEEAVRLSPASPETNYSLAFVLTLIGEPERGITAARRAIDLNPNYAEAYAVLALALVFFGDLEASLAACRQSARSNPRDARGNHLYNAMGHAYFMLGDYEQAIEVAKRGYHQDPSVYGQTVTLAASYACLGNKVEAKYYIDDLLRFIPRINLRAFQKNPLFIRPEHIEKLVEALRLAGLPE
jgi:adenylate cyclase